MFAHVRGTVAGVPCKSVSNAKEHQLVDAISSESGVTGKVFSKIHKYNQRVCEDLDFQILENVKGLLRRPKDGGSSNHDIVMWKTSSALSAYAATLCLDPFHLNFDVHRPLLYMLFVSWRKLPGFDSTELDKHVQECLDVSHQCSRGFCIDDLVHPETHPEVQRYLESCRNLPLPKSSETHKRSRENPEGLKWCQMHMKYGEKTGQAWWESPVPDEATMQKYLGLRDITLRQFDLLRYKAHVHFPKLVQRSCDLSQSILRMGSGGNAMRTQTENSEVFLTGRCRTCLGSEKLQISGAHFRDQHKSLDQFPESLKRRLAGNAFHIWPATIALLTCIVLLAKGHSAAKAQAASANQPSASCEAVSEDSEQPVQADDGNIFDLLWAV